MIKESTLLVGAEYPKYVIPLIARARGKIDIVVYDWRWYANQPAHIVQRFNIALVNAVKRGVTVRAVLNKAELLPTLAKVGIKGRKMKDHRTVHSKLIVFDDTIAVIGSHNFTRNAFGANVESSVIVSIPSGERRFSTFFENLYSI